MGHGRKKGSVLAELGLILFNHSWLCDSGHTEMSLSLDICESLLCRLPKGCHSKKWSWSWYEAGVWLLFILLKSLVIHSFSLPRHLTFPTHSLFLYTKSCQPLCSSIYFCIFYFYHVLWQKLALFTPAPDRGPMHNKYCWLIILKSFMILFLPHI